MHGGVFGGQVTHHGGLFRTFVELAVGKRDRERAHRRVGETTDQRHDAGRVQPTAEVGADRHVGAQAQAYGVDQQLAQLGGGLLLRAEHAPGARHGLIRGGGETPVPVTAQRFAAAVVHGQYVAGVAGCECPRRPWRGRPGPSSSASAPGLSDRAWPVAATRPARALISEPNQSRPWARVWNERTDTSAVAGQQQPAPLGVPQRNRELAVEMADEVIAVLFVQVHDHFGVGLRIETMALAFQLLPQFDVVEDLAVEHRPHGAPLVVDRLLAGGKINDRQPRMRQPHAVAHMEAVTVRRRGDAAYGSSAPAWPELFRALRERLKNLRFHTCDADSGVLVIRPE